MKGGGGGGGGVYMDLLGGWWLEIQIFCSGFVGCVPRSCGPVYPEKTSPGVLPWTLQRGAVPGTTGAPLTSRTVTLVR